MGERLRLALAQRLETSPGDVASRLAQVAPASAEAGLAVVKQALRAGAGRKGAQKAEEPTPGIRLVAGCCGLHQSLTLSGPTVDQNIAARLIAWLKTQEEA